MPAETYYRLEEVEAIQFTGENAKEIREFTNALFEINAQASHSKDTWWLSFENRDVAVKPGYYIVKRWGQYFTWKPSIFEKVFKLRDNFRDHMNDF